MAAANESQGLKIAVAAFVALTVILAVACYFLYSNYSQTDVKLTAAEQKLRDAQKAQSDLVDQVGELRKAIGSRQEEFDAVKTEIKTENQKITDEINGIATQVSADVAKAQAAGAQGPELEDAKVKAQQTVSAYVNEPNKNYISSLSRLKDLVRGLSSQITALSINYAEVKRSLESVDRVNRDKLDVLTKKVAELQKELEGEQTKHVQERATLLAKVDQYQTDIAKYQTDIASLNTKLRSQEEDSTKRVSNLSLMLREKNEQLSKGENVLDVPDGTITYVDYNRGEVHTNVTRGMGARPQMVFAIFDRTSAGVPTDKPKGTIELIQVGERFSVGRIVETKVRIEPIRVGDLVYSAAWSPHEPMRFALIGKMDVNRDGKDDRADLKRMIEAAGGIVDYDLPPPEVGKETGELSARDAWYVIDDRMPLVQTGTTRQDLASSDNAEFLKKRSESIREARLNGIRPIKIERLLSYLGYNYAAPIVGRPEAVDRARLKGMMRPRHDVPKPAAGASAPAEDGAAPAGEEKPAAGAEDKPADGDAAMPGDANK